MPVQASTTVEGHTESRCSGGLWGGEWDTGWGGDLLFKYILVLPECCTGHAHYLLKKQVEVEKGANWIWRVNGRYLNPKVSFALSSLFYFLLFIPFFLQESVLNF